MELDMLPPDELERLVSGSIEDYIDWGQWNENLRRTEWEREEVRRRIEVLLGVIVDKVSGSRVKATSFHLGQSVALLMAKFGQARGWRWQKWQFT